jgi:hypothetical protein
MKAAPKLVDARPNIDMEANILGLDGKELTEPPTVDSEGKVVREGGQKIVLRDLCRNALLRDEKDLDPKGKLDRFLLAMLIEKKRRPRLSVGDVKLLVDRIGAIYPPLLVGRAWELLDPNAVKHLDGDEGG